MSRRSARRQRSQKFRGERLREAQEKSGADEMRAAARTGAGACAPTGTDDNTDSTVDAEHDERDDQYSAATSSVSPDHDNPNVAHDRSHAHGSRDRDGEDAGDDTDEAGDGGDAPDAEDPDLSEIGRAPGELPASSPFESRGPTRFRVLRYTEDSCEQVEFSDVDRLLPYSEPPGPKEDQSRVTWVQMIGITDPVVVHIVGAVFDLPMLAQEDVLAEWSRTKFDEYGGMALAIARAVRLDLAQAQPEGQQISFIAGPHFVISFHENDEPVFEAVERRIREDSGRQRQGGSGYLFYALFDTLVDRMLYLAEEIEDSISEIEDKNLATPYDLDLGEVHRHLSLVAHLSRLAVPLRETVRRLQRSDHELLSTLPAMYFSDLNDHVLRVGDRLEHARMILQELRDYHFILQGQKTNEIIRMLTVISSIFIPLTFIVGIYGMNFENMPELKTQYGYFVCLGAMALFIVGAIVYFKRKKWL